jgi:hypothetical protein
MRSSYRFLSILALAACTQTAAPPGCPSGVARELSTLDDLVAETERAIATGYRTEYRTRSSGFNFCLGSGHNHVGLSYCTGGGTQGRKVAIDPAAEQRKLDGLNERRRALVAGNPQCRP